MPLYFPAYANVDDAARKRTEEFFDNARTASDEELLKLVKQGICLEAGNAIHDTAMAMLARYGKTNIIQELLAAGANIEARGLSNWTGLMSAALNGRTDTVKALLQAGANIEALGDECETALMSAAYRAQTETVQALLAAGANIEARNEKGQTALILAAHEELNDGTLRALMAAGANIAACDNDGVTPLSSVNGQRIEIFLKTTRWNESNQFFIPWDKSHDFFVEDRSTVPESAAEVYQLLAVAPLVNPRATVDFIGNIRKIFVHARWKNKEHATDILTEMQGDGRINAETVDSILDATFRKRSHAARLQRHDPGMML